MGNRDGFTQRGFQLIDRSLLCFYFDDPDCVSVIVSCLAYGLISGGNSHEIGSVIENSCRREKDKGKDYDAHYIVRSRSSLERPEQKFLHSCAASGQRLPTKQDA